MCLIRNPEKGEEGKQTAHLLPLRFLPSMELQNRFFRLMKTQGKIKKVARIYH